MIVVDWSSCSGDKVLTYFSSCYSTAEVGDTVADFIKYTH